MIPVICLSWVYPLPWHSWASHVRVVSEPQLNPAWKWLCCGQEVESDCHIGPWLPASNAFALIDSYQRDSSVNKRGYSPISLPPPQVDAGTYVQARPNALGMDWAQKPSDFHPAGLSAMRRSRMRVRLALKSLSPRREAERYSTVESSGRNRNSTSSTKPKNCKAQNRDARGVGSRDHKARERKRRNCQHRHHAQVIKT